MPRIGVDLWSTNYYVKRKSPSIGNHVPDYVSFLFKELYEHNIDVILGLMKA
jgi:hypothetical protein